MPLTHYIIVRRGLTLGQTVAQVAHAAGESFYLLHSGVAQLLERPAPARVSAEVGGANPSTGATFDPSRTVVVVLGARSEAKLLTLARKLTADRIPHVVIAEPDPPFNNSVTAVGLAPGDKDTLLPYVKDFHLLPEPIETTV